MGSPSQWDQFVQWIRRILTVIHKRGSQKLTIMVIPHTERKILNMHLSLYSVSALLITLILVSAVSIMSLVGKSGEAIEYYDIGLTNSQFNIQSVKIAEEILPLHDLVERYSNTIADLYVKLDGKEGDVDGQGGVAQAVIGNEIQELRRLMNECREKGEDCEQSTIDHILQRVIFLSAQDNQSLNRAVELSDKILDELKTKEKQNLLKNTPTIWPVNGYVISPFGWQTDPLRGKHIFRQGMEIGALPGTEIKATAPGEVMDVRYDETYGLSVWIKHRFGIKTYYAHMDRVNVTINDRVSKGEVIGYAGKSGNAPISMLYYEVHVGTVAYNPLSFLNHLQDQWLIKPKL